MNFIYFDLVARVVMFFSRVPNRRSKHCFSNPKPIKYCGKFPNQTNFMKQYTYADFFAISHKEHPVCTVFCFERSCKEANIWFVLLVYRSQLIADY